MPSPPSDGRRTAHTTALTFGQILLLVLVTLSSLSLAHCSSPKLSEDHNHHRIPGDDAGPVEGLLHAPSMEMYEPDFVGVERSIIGRAADGVTQLENNEATRLELALGSTQSLVFTRDKLFRPQTPKPQKRDDSEGAGSEWDEEDDTMPEGAEDGATGGGESRRRQDAGPRQLWITVTTCAQPVWNNTNSPAATPPQLQVFVSQSPSNSDPGPGNPAGPPTQAFDGLANVTLKATSDVFIGVSAPAVAGNNFDGGYSYEIAASIDGPYHSFVNDSNNLWLVDSDFDSSLLVTKNLTVENAAAPKQPPFVLFAYNTDNRSTLGLQRSFCGLEERAPIGPRNDTTLKMSLTKRPLVDTPRNTSKAQFYLPGLKRETQYVGILGKPSQGKGIVGGGGKVWSAMSFNTRRDDNCQLIFDLPFCDGVAWSVPTNRVDRALSANLSLLYDANAQSYMKNFTNALALTACETESTAQYSLAVNCTSCANAYKDWLCAVTMPRCADFSSPDDFLHVRNVLSNFPDGRPAPAAVDQSDLDNQQSTFGNQSRMPWVDDVVKPGPYKEILPCEGVCHNLVRNCPPALQFVCPQAGKGLEHSYGKLSKNGNVTCNRIGGAYFLSDGVVSADFMRPWQTWGVSIAVALVGCWI